MNMQYEGYEGSVEYSLEDEVFHGQVLNLRAVLTYEAQTPEDLRAEFEATVDNYLAWCEERGKEAERPYSGKFLLRITPDLHRRAAEAAKAAGAKSLNAWVAQVIERAADGADVASTIDPAFVAEMRELLAALRELSVPEPEPEPGARVVRIARRAGKARDVGATKRAAAKKPVAKKTAKKTTAKRSTTQRATSNKVVAAKPTTKRETKRKSTGRKRSLTAGL